MIQEVPILNNALSEIMVEYQNQISKSVNSYAKTLIKTATANITNMNFRNYKTYTEYL